MKAPKRVIKELISIQRNFSWGGNYERKKIARVKWSEVCKPKKSGGLGIKELHLFNLSLLGKWRWRLEREEKALWNEVLNFRYRVGHSANSNNANIHLCQISSIWWGGLCSIEGGNQVPLGWFKAGLFKKVGDGRSTYFWDDVWLGSESLKNQFPRLFSIADNKEAKVA